MISVKQLKGMDRIQIRDLFLDELRNFNPLFHREVRIPIMPELSVLDYIEVPLKYKPMPELVFKYDGGWQLVEMINF